jgi:hypothetical protein
MDPDFEKLWANPTLGAAANGVFLDVMEAQMNENHSAEVEGRPARIAKRDQRFPGWEQGKDIHSAYSDVTFGNEFSDGEAVSVPQGGSEVPASGTIIAARKALEPLVKPRTEASPAPKAAPKAETK